MLGGTMVRPRQGKKGFVDHLPPGQVEFYVAAEGDQAMVLHHADHALLAEIIVHKTDGTQQFVTMHTDWLDPI